MFSFAEYLKNHSIKAYKENINLCVKLSNVLRNNPTTSKELRSFLWCIYFSEEEIEQSVIWFKRHKEYLRVRERINKKRRNV